MKKILFGLLFGFIAGIIDIIPMMIQNLTWDANLSALSMWIVAGLFISTSDIKLHPVLKGILISFLVLIPSSFIIGWKKPVTLLPIFVMTLILGSLLGFTFEKIKLIIRQEKKNEY
jgi:hypothetical protein